MNRACSAGRVLAGLAALCAWSIAPFLAHASGPAGTWSQLQGPALPPYPPGRVYHSAIHDPDGARMVTFGGYLAFNDVWEMNLAGPAAWTPLAAAGTPPSPRWGHASVYDPVRKRMIVMGGYDNSYQYNTVHALTLTGTPTWSQITTSGTPPEPRRNHRMIYDPVRDRLIVLGGYAGHQPDPGVFVNDVWVLIGLSGFPALWTRITPAGTPPSARSLMYTVYDPVGDRLISFGGWDGSYRNDVWALNLSGPPAWSQLAPSGTPPSPRRDGGAVHDPIAGRLVVFGGQDADGLLDDVWQLDLSGSPAWSSVPAAGVPCPERSGFGAILDPAANRLIVSGGYDGAENIADAWSLSLASGTETWSPVLTAPPVAPGNADYAVIHDSGRQRAVYFGGRKATYFGQTWLLDLDATPGFSQLYTTHRPSPRHSATAVFDAVNDRMLLFGGNDSNHRNDVWSLSFAGTPDWTPVTALGPLPPPRTDHTAVDDAGRQRMVVFGGTNGADLNDVWTLPYSGAPQWSPLLPSGTPPSPRRGHGAVYVPSEDRMLIFGGYDAGGTLNDLWALEFTPSPSWLQLSPAGTLPWPRGGATMTFDPIRNRVLLHGGSFNEIGSGTREVWELALGPTPEWTLLAPSGPLPGPRDLMLWFHQPGSDRMIVYGGQQAGNGYLSDSWFLEFGQTTDVPVEPGRRAELAIQSIAPNPAVDRVTLALTLPDARPVRIELLDLAGRRVHRLDLGVQGPGTRQAGLAGLDRLPAGVYIVHARAGGETATSRLAIVR